MAEGLLVFGKGYIPIYDPVTDVGYFIQLPYAGKLVCERKRFSKESKETCAKRAGSVVDEREGSD
jgi:hypothetical protein